MAAPAEDLDDAVRRSDPDRWLASRFIADRERRADVIALYAFEHVLARVPAQVSEPLMGEIRLAWWSEALEEMFEGRRVRSHPVALSLAEAVRRRALTRAPLQSLIDARLGDLDRAPFADEAAVLAYAANTAGALMQAAAQALGAPTELGAARDAGQAYGLALMAHRRAIGGQTRLPGALTPERLRARLLEALASARTGLAVLPVQAFPALSYAALAARTATGAPMALLERQLRLIWASATGRI
jgi:phytoene synthase